MLSTDLSSLCPTHPHREGQTNERVSEALAEVYTDPFCASTLPLIEGAVIK